MALDVKAAMQAIGAALDTVTGLQVYDYPADKVVPPCAVVAFPDLIVYDETVRRGLDRARFKVWVVVSRAVDRSAADQLADLLSGAGSASTSVVAALDALGGHVRCEQAQPQELHFDGVPHWGAVLDVDYLA